MVKVKIKLMSSGARVPMKGTVGAACFDLYSSGDCWIESGCTELVHTGICLEIPPGYEGRVRSRSGMALKGIQVMHGTIDSDYRGEVCVIVRSDRPTFFECGTRLAQLAIKRVEPLEFDVVPELSGTERGENGFGSTGY